MAGKQLGRPTSRENWVKKNAVLMEMGSNFPIRLTSQSPVFCVKAICPLPDGSDKQSAGIYANEPDAYAGELMETKRSCRFEWLHRG